MHTSDDKNCFGANVAKDVQSLLTKQSTVHRIAKKDKRIY